MERCFTFAKSDFKRFFDLMSSFGAVQAPVRVSDLSFSFKSVTSPEQIAFEALRTILPPKKFFYPQQEALIEFDREGIRQVEVDMSPKVIFGVHPCDLAGLGIIDKIFTAEPADSHYLARRAATLIVGLSCLPDKHCFCQSMGTDTPSSGYDIFLTDIGQSYFLQVHTPAGLTLVESATSFIKAAETNDRHCYKQFWHRRADLFEMGFEGENLPAVFDMEWDNPLWEELGKRCLSCGNCTPVCPTCYCFDLVDIAALNNDTGERQRQWDSCQFVGFAQVGGGFNFRPPPVDRFKFWYRHKLHGFDDPYGFKTCVGCGRCTVSCPAGIDDIVKVVLTLQGIENGGKK